MKQKAVMYFKSSKEAEDAITTYEDIKYSADIHMVHKQGMYEGMISHLKKSITNKI